MSRRMLSLLPAIVLLPGLLPAQAEKFNLQKFVDLAVRGSQGIQIVQESVASAEQKIGETKSLYYPQVNLSGSYTRVSLVSEFDMTINGKMQHFVFMPADNFNFRLTASEQLFNWGRTQSAVRLSRIGASLARDALEMATQVTAYQVVPIYYNMLFLDEAVKVLDETRSLFDQRLSILKTRYDAGLASDFDLSLIQVQMSGIDSQKVEFRNTVRKLALTYNRVAGRPLEEPLEIDDRLAFQPLQIDADALIREALSNRIELKQLQDQEKLAATQVALAKTGNKPTLSASFTYEFRNGFLPDVTVLRGNWSAVLSAAYPLFDGFRTRSQVAQAQIGQRTVEKQWSDQAAAIGAEIRQIVSDLKSIEEKVAIEKIRLGHAQKAQKIAEERYEKGLMSTTDLIEAQNALSNSRLSIIQLTVGYVLNQYNLYRAVGRKIYRSDS